ncbi:NAD-dependent epimerase/dehydratase family protein [Streptomyces sp. KLOTTS4A1]|uniref:NAD-dependent epimerase/dehydratase family protein n=1 Tax=Streptomyces sp. KLOTTS4A1 TaxID=3390996 RepID=UPI0039F5AB25
MRLLILGGTEFAGRAVTERALARGWEVTVFHRGSHPAPDGVTAVHGDRTETGGLDALAGGEWDAVVDTWSKEPGAVRDSARLLRGRVATYAYVSSLSVYTWAPPAGFDESAPVVAGDPDSGSCEDYAQAKRGAELAVEREFGAEGALHVRAGLLLGPYENIGRLPWWLGRIARGGPVLAPGPRELPLSYVDVRDTAEWILDAVEAGLSGPYNMVSPSGHTTMGGFLDSVVDVVGSDAELRWTEPQVILDAGIEPWTQLPVWVPPGSDMHDALHTSDVSRALATGLRCRPVRETVADTWAWLQAIGGTAPQRPDRPGKGVDPEVEAKVLGETL